MALPSGARLGADATQALSALCGYRAYGRRWVFLLVLSLLSFSNATVRGLGLLRERAGGGGPSSDPA